MKLSRLSKWAIAIAAYLGICFAGVVFVLTKYFDESHPPPISTSTFLFITFVGGPLVVVAYCLLEGLFEGFAVLLARLAALVFRRIRRKP